jgi:hypothetical protein
MYFFRTLSLTPVSVNGDPQRQREVHGRRGSGERNTIRASDIDSRITQWLSESTMSAPLAAVRQLGDFRRSTDVGRYVLPGIAQLGD